METLTVELSSEGTLTLPESIRRDLPPGTRFRVHRKENSIVLKALRREPSTPFDLTGRAFEFANELVAERHHEYLVRVALGSIR